MTNSEIVNILIKRLKEKGLPVTTDNFKNEIENILKLAEYEI